MIDGFLLADGKAVAAGLLGFAGSLLCVLRPLKYNWSQTLTHDPSAPKNIMKRKQPAWPVQMHMKRCGVQSERCKSETGMCSNLMECVTV